MGLGATQLGDFDPTIFNILFIFSKLPPPSRYQHALFLFCSSVSIQQTDAESKEKQKAKESAVQGTTGNDRNTSVCDKYFHSRFFAVNVCSDSSVVSTKP